MENISDDELLNNGFTEKEIKKIKRVIKEGKDIGDVDTISSILYDLKRRFLLHIYFFIFLFFILPFSFDFKYINQLFTYVITLILVVGISVMANPIVLCAKSYFFLKKKGRKAP